MVPVCTELPLILSQGDTEVPLIDSTRAHVKAGVGGVGYAFGYNRGPDSCQSGEEVHPRIPDSR